MKTVKNMKQSRFILFVLSIPDDEYWECLCAKYYCNRYGSR